MLRSAPAYRFIYNNQAEPRARRHVVERHLAERSVTSEEGREVPIGITVPADRGKNVRTRQKPGHGNIFAEESVNCQHSALYSVRIRPDSSPEQTLRHRLDITGIGPLLPCRADNPGRTFANASPATAALILSRAANRLTFSSYKKSS